MDRLDTLIERQGTPRWGWMDRTIILLMLTFVVWAAFARLDQVTTAAGEVIPQGKVKLIQHLEGGIILRLPVQEGQIVKAGDPLIELNLASGGLNRDEIRVRLDSLLLQRLRLEAEAHNRKLDFPQKLAAPYPELVDVERRTMVARQAEYESSMAVIRQQVNQREQELLELQSQSQATRANLALVERQHRIVENLFRENLASELQVIEISQKRQELLGQLSVAERSISRSQAALAQAREQRQQAQKAHARTVLEELTVVEQTIAELRERLARADEQELRAVIRSPIDGVVKQMRYHTIGGVVKPGEPLMEIVPTDEKLVIEARLNPADRGYVRSGQRADVKVTAYDFVRYGALEGQVQWIAADTETGADKQAFYRLVVSTSNNYLGDDPDQFRITPGMEATVDVHIGRQSVWSYLVRPVLKLRHEAFREP